MLSNSAAAELGVSRLQREDFYRDRERRVFDAFTVVVGEGGTADRVTIAARMGGGGAARDYVSTLVDGCPASTNISRYVDIVQEASYRRRLATALAQMEVIADANDKAPDELHRCCTELLGAAAPKTMSLSNVPVYSGVEMSAMEIIEPEPIVEGLAYAACSTYLFGKNKGGGKTTAMLDVCRQRISDEEWCGRKTKPGPVLYLSEQSPQSFNPQCVRAGLLNVADFHVIYHSDVVRQGLSWPEVGELIIQTAAQRDVDLVFIDNFSLWVGFEGDEENSAGEGNCSMAVVEKLTSAGLCVVGMQHTRKDEGTIYDAARGSSAIAGRFDMLAWIKGSSFPRRRVIRAVGRVFAEDPADFTIELDDAHRYRQVGEGPGVLEHDVETVILDCLPLGPEGARREDDVIAVCKARDIGRDTASKTLRKLCDPADSGRPVERDRGVIPEFQGFGYWRRTES